MELTVDRNDEDNLVFRISLVLTEEGFDPVSIEASHELPSDRFRGEKALAQSSLEVSSVLMGKLLGSIRGGLSNRLREAVYAGVLQSMGIPSPTFMRTPDGGQDAGSPG